MPQVPGLTAQSPAKLLRADRVQDCWCVVRERILTFGLAANGRLLTWQQEAVIRHNQRLYQYGQVIL